MFQSVPIAQVFTSVGCSANNFHGQGIIGDSDTRYKTIDHPCEFIAQDEHLQGASLS